MTNGVVGHNAIVSGGELPSGQHECECGEVLAERLYGDMVWSSDGSFDSLMVTVLKAAHKRHVKQVLMEKEEDE